MPREEIQFLNVGNFLALGVHTGLKALMVMRYGPGEVTDIHDKYRSASESFSDTELEHIM